MTTTTQQHLGHLTEQGLWSLRMAWLCDKTTIAAVLRGVILLLVSFTLTPFPSPRNSAPRLWRSSQWFSCLGSVFFFRTCLLWRTTTQHAGRVQRFRLLADV